MGIEFLSWLRIMTRLEEVRVELEEFFGSLHHARTRVDVALQEGVTGPDLWLGVHHGGADGVEHSQEVDDTQHLAEGQTFRIVGMSVARHLGVLEDEDTQTLCVVGAEAHFRQTGVEEATQGTVQTNRLHGGEEFKVNADLLSEDVVVQTPDTVGVVCWQQLGDEMIILFVLIVCAGCGWR